MWMEFRDRSLPEVKDVGSRDLELAVEEWVASAKSSTCSVGERIESTRLGEEQARSGADGGTRRC